MKITNGLTSRMEVDFVTSGTESGNSGSHSFFMYMFWTDGPDVQSSGGYFVYFGTNTTTQVGARLLVAPSRLSIAAIQLLATGSHSSAFDVAEFGGEGSRTANVESGLVGADPFTSWPIADGTSARSTWLHAYCHCTGDVRNLGNATYQLLQPVSANSVKVIGTVRVTHAEHFES